MACNVSLLGFDGLQEDRDDVSLFLSGMVGTERAVIFASQSQCDADSR